MPIPPDISRKIPSPYSILNPNAWQPQVAANGQPQTYVTPQWGLLKPFALTSGSEFRPAGPAVYGSALYSQQVADAVATSANLTDQQKVIAEYWEDGPAHYCYYAEFVSQRDHHTLDQDVKMMFLLTQAMSDAMIAAWDAKLAYNAERPITAVRYVEAGKKIQAWGGPGRGTQQIDGASWQPYLVVPAFPEHVSGHSTYSAAASEVLKDFTGSDTLGVSFTEPAGASTIESAITPHQAITLQWPTFTAAALESENHASTAEFTSKPPTTWEKRSGVKSVLLFGPSRFAISPVRQRREHRISLP